MASLLKELLFLGMAAYGDELIFRESSQELQSKTQNANYQVAGGQIEFASRLSHFLILSLQKSRYTL